MASTARIVSSLAAACAMTLCAWAAPARAGLVLQSTRLVISPETRDATLAIRNAGAGPVLAQSWLDDGNADTSPVDMRVPFVLAPAVVRVDPDSGAVLRISYTREPLPADRESLFYLNVLETPPRDPNDANVLIFQFRSRIKVFFRPNSLRPHVQAAPGLLTWKLSGQALEVTNPTPYHVSFASVDLIAGGRRTALEGGMVAPFDKTRFAFPARAPKPAGKVSVQYEVITDYGGTSKNEKTVTE
ncbi:gram-negative pili assembly chaperone, N-terminal domain protein 1 [Achromobacter xylosoxidans A8]|uniref:Gram-negative pili assembly chaperone, N-terminal domain protein 1 n=1 Tax=Achromobacter xylosoxidans (strain A8) TaxID=762376 RepID=E3HLJ2_ACHXA|nr:molecular chaperone [Achromobacter xylosoxidans]ADP19327.1 gram-negative pili assembly chaperone, N-terminal domain protein 1 [Achromobacter xylosoxidans A8]